MVLPTLAKHFQQKAENVSHNAQICDTKNILHIFLSKSFPQTVHMDT